MTNIQWLAPPAKAHGNSKMEWHPIAEALKERPGEWALVGQFLPSHANAIRTGSKVAFRPAGSFETRLVKIGTDERLHDLYIRYVGASDKAVEAARESDRAKVEAIA